MFMNASLCAQMLCLLRVGGGCVETARPSPRRRISPETSTEQNVSLPVDTIDTVLTNHVLCSRAAS